MGERMRLKLAKQFWALFCGTSSDLNTHRAVAFLISSMDDIIRSHEHVME